MPEPTPAPLRDWSLLTSWLEAEWKGVDPRAFPELHGFYEALFTVAETMKNSPPAEREGCLYTFLNSTLTSSGRELEEVV